MFLQFLENTGYAIHVPQSTSTSRGLKGIRKKLVTGFPERLKKITLLIWWLGDCFSEAESARIRSAVKFFFDLDVRKKFNSSEKYFPGRPKDGNMIFSAKSQILNEFL